MIYVKWHSVAYKYTKPSIFNMFVPLKRLINNKQEGIEDQNITHLSSTGPFKNTKKKVSMIRKYDNHTLLVWYVPGWQFNVIDSFTDGSCCVV